MNLWRARLVMLLSVGLCLTVCLFLWLSASLSLNCRRFVDPRPTLSAWTPLIATSGTTVLLYAGDRKSHWKDCTNFTSRPDCCCCTEVQALYTQKILLIGTGDHLFKKCWSRTLSLKWTVETACMLRMEKRKEELSSGFRAAWSGLPPATTRTSTSTRRQTDRQLRHLSSPLPLVACFYIPRNETSNRPSHLTTGGSLPVCWAAALQVRHRHNTAALEPAAANQFALMN